MIDKTPNDRLNRLLNQLRLTEPPGWLRRDLTSIPQATNQSIGVSRANSFDTLRQVVAHLVHDAVGPIAIAGARSAGVATRDVVHRWDDYDLVLTIPMSTGPISMSAVDAGTQLEVEGQVFGPDESRWHLSITNAEDTVVTAADLQLDGSFSFSVAAREIFTVVLSDDVVAVRCGPISLDPT